MIDIKGKATLYSSKIVHISL